MKKSYEVEVDCANCAAKMQEAAAKCEGVKDIIINFMTEKMTIEYEEGFDEKAVLERVVETCKRVDDDFEIK